MISRVADHCFWFGRYLERTESTARVLAVTTNLALDAELTLEQCWLPVIIVAGEKEQFFSRHGEESAGWSEAVPRYMTWEEDNLTSIVRSVAAVRENARSIREVLSLEAWETTNELYLWMSSPEAPRRVRQGSLRLLPPHPARRCSSAWASCAAPCSTTRRSISSGSA